MVAEALAERWGLARPRTASWRGIAEGARRRAGACPAGRRAPRVAVLCPQTYMNDAGRSVGPARGSLQAGARARARRPRRDRPAVRRGAHAPGRRPGRPQRPEVDQARAGQRRVHARARRRRASRHHATRRSSRPTCSAAFARAASEVDELVERACEEVERIVLGERAEPAERGRPRPRPARAASWRMALRMPLRSLLAHVEEDAAALRWRARAATRSCPRRCART